MLTDRLAIDGGTPVRRGFPPLGKGVDLVDDEEVDAVVAVLRDRKLFRYHGPRTQSRVSEFEAAVCDAFGSAFALGTSSGGEILGLETGTIAAGQLADLVAVDLEDFSLHPRGSLLKNVVYAMSHRAVTDVWVHGRQIVADRRLATIDQSRLLARVRELTNGWRAPTPKVQRMGR